MKDFHYPNSLQSYSIQNHDLQQRKFSKTLEEVNILLRKHDNMYRNVDAKYKTG